MQPLVAILDSTTLLKIVAEVITAGSGVLGLLTSFKKKVHAKGGTSSKKEIEVITVPGRIALVGILLGFGVSITITILDARAGKLKERQHQHEFAALSQPISKTMLVTIWYESFSSEDYPRSQSELPDMGEIIFLKGNKPSRATMDSADLIFVPEIVADRHFGETSGPDFLVMSPNNHNHTYVEESRQFEIDYRAKDSFLGSDELGGSTLAFVLYQQKGAAKFAFRGIALPVTTGNTLQVAADEFKKTTAEHQTIVDESAKMSGAKGEEPKTITEMYYCYTLPVQ